VLKEFPLEFAAEGNQMYKLEGSVVLIQISMKKNVEETTPAS
jgi:hypothetical protein